MGLVSSVFLQAQFSHASIHEPRSWRPHLEFYGESLDVQQAVISGPVGDLNALSHTGYATLRHAAFPKYSVRVKKSRFCDGTVEYVHILIPRHSR